VKSPCRDLEDMCTALAGARVTGRLPKGTEVSGITSDSRQVRPGSVFVCLKGARHDGHAFVPKAVRDGAVAVVAGHPLRSAAPVVLVEDTRRALAELSAAFWDYPSRHMDVIGVTGTNGKTTTTYMLESILRKAGKKPALLGTVEYRFGGRKFPHVHTTAEAPDLQRVLAAVRSGGGNTVAMEVSSHSLVQSRVVGVGFRAGVFTNLTRDHLDFHGTMRRYFEAKARLFEGLPPAELGGVAVINLDSPAGPAFAGRTAARVISYGVIGHGVSRRTGVFLAASEVETSVAGTRFLLSAGSFRMRVGLRLLGAYNVANALAAAGAAHGIGIGWPDIGRGLECLERVPGRLERVVSMPFTAVVDYAHTPDALERVLVAARGLARRNVIVVFGCGGNRDRGKRPQMGGIATELTDFAWITSDNPRDEDPLSIIREIQAGIRRTGRHAIEPDRRRAIAAALEQARPGDMVVIAGKGHERAQLVRGRAFPFDDAAVVRSLCRVRGRRS